MCLNSCVLFPAGIESAGVMKKKKKSIRRESLRQFYGNSVNSPNLTEVPSAVIKMRRSPRLAGMRLQCLEISPIAYVNFFFFLSIRGFMHIDATDA